MLDLQQLTTLVGWTGPLAVFTDRAEAVHAVSKLKRLLCFVADAQVSS